MESIRNHELFYSEQLEPNILEHHRHHHYLPQKNKLWESTKWIKKSGLILHLVLLQAGAWTSNLLGSFPAWVILWWKWISPESERKPCARQILNGSLLLEATISSENPNLVWNIFPLLYSGHSFTYFHILEAIQMAIVQNAKEKQKEKRKKGILKEAK